jgi:hypothetical protein
VDDTDDQLNEKELEAIEEQLTQEKLLIKKYKDMAADSVDRILEGKYNDIASKHQEHFDTLYSYLQ